MEGEFLVLLGIISVNPVLCKIEESLCVYYIYYCGIWVYFEMPNTPVKGRRVRNEILKKKVMPLEIKNSGFIKSSYQC